MEILLSSSVMSSFSVELERRILDLVAKETLHGWIECSVLYSFR